MNPSNIFFNFLSCHYTKNFWSEVNYKIYGLLMIRSRLKNFQSGCEDEIFVNHILLLAKQYLYSGTQNRYSPSI